MNEGEKLEEAAAFVLRERRRPRDEMSFFFVDDL
jgi:hypothetical protein